ncbi:DUF4239 domain-containing protein [Catenulispora sp. NF23]|uniref:DUF4239 domain-containing protein n=1 Tax=Catenulispora pinistramenti TaxID=2705254 RepID=A0ABS5KVI7_9ACTN|nr:DUF4239 domain-containing protein [Catenulispora pinistramenti]MBS2535459.1 DUF4239 domain-containing protein [Catenulispora pinistramenti]MBS2550070.1 DUF4239 domain-containing protein [Catenulispora pinistramenti]
MLIVWPVLSILAGAVVAVGLTAVLGRTQRAKDGSFNPQALSVIGSTLLSSFILVTAFLIAGSWSTYTTDRQHVYDEARSTTVAYWLAGKLPADDAKHVQNGLTTYVDDVVNYEWPLMSRQQVSTSAWTTLDGLRGFVAAIHPADDAGAKAQSDVATSLDDIYSKRSIRTADVHYTMPSIMYVALIVAALLLIAFPLLVGLTTNARNVAMLAGVGATVGLGIYIAIALAHPYSQPLEISPTAFKLALQRFGQITSTSPPTL